MSARPVIMSVAGARPNFMKIAPLARQLAARTEVRHVVVHTGQHYDDNMSAAFFRELALPPPEITLGVGSAGHAVQTARILEALEPVLLEWKPAWVVVVGDVNSTLAAALAAAKLGIRTAHVEAGLRSFDRSMPEEINRVVTDALADLLFTPSPDADDNLRREGIPPEKVMRVGNIMIDTLVMNLERIQATEASRKLGLSPRSYAYITLHRPGNVDAAETLAAVSEELRRLAGQVAVVFPVHPRTRRRLEEFSLWEHLAGQPGMFLLPPIGYLESIELAMNARFVLTDSGGLQEETTFLGVPCLTLRPNTERPITITEGTNRLTSLARLRGDIEDTLDGRHPPPRRRLPELWDGRTGERIAAALVERI